MSNIPADLQRLWAERDRSISLGESDDTSPLLFIRDEEAWEPEPQHPLPSQSLLREVIPIPPSKIFPVYSLKPQTISLGTHHGRTPGNP